MATRLIWTIKVYNTGGAKKPWRVKIAAAPSTPDAIWNYGEGKGDTQAYAYAEAVAGLRVRPELVR